MAAKSKAPTKRVGRVPELVKKVVIVDDEGEEHETILGDYVVKLIGVGHDIDDVCEAAGIEPKTYYNWMTQGRFAAKTLAAGHELDEIGEAYLQFLQRASRARGRLRRRLESRIEELVPNMDPREATDVLARLSKIKWSKASTVSVDLHGQIIVESHGEAVTTLLRSVIDGLVALAPAAARTKMIEASPGIVQGALAQVIEGHVVEEDSG